MSANAEVSPTNLFHPFSSRPAPEQTVPQEAYAALGEQVAMAYETIREIRQGMDAEQYAVAVLPPISAAFRGLATMFDEAAKAEDPQRVLQQLPEEVNRITLRIESEQRHLIQRQRFEDAMDRIHLDIKTKIVSWDSEHGVVSCQGKRVTSTSKERSPTSTLPQTDAADRAAVRSLIAPTLLTVYAALAQSELSLHSRRVEEAHQLLTQAHALSTTLFDERHRLVHAIRRSLEDFQR